MRDGHPSLTRSVLVTLVGNALPPVAALCTAPLLAQGLGVDGRGQVAAAQAVALLAISITAFGLPEALTHFVARGVRHSARAVAVFCAFTIAVGAAATLIVFALADWLGGGSSLTTQLIRLGAVSIIPSLLLGLVRGWAAGQELWSRIAAERLVTSGVRLAGVVILFVSGDLSVHTAAILLLFAPLLGVLPYLRRASGHRRRVEAVPDAGLRDIASYSFRLWIGSVSGILLMRIDQAVLVPLADATQLGLYAVAVAVSEVPLVVNSAIRDVTFARHSGHFSSAALAQAARLSGLVTAAIALVLAALLPWGIPTLFGAEFRDSIAVTWLLLVAVTIGTPGSIAGAGLSALGRPGLRSASLAVAAVVNVLVLLALAPKWGALGAAFATLLGNLVSSNMNIHWLNKLGGTSWAAMYVVGRADVTAALRAVRTLLRPREASREGVL